MNRKPMRAMLVSSAAYCTPSHKLIRHRQPFHASRTLRKEANQDFRMAPTPDAYWLALRRVHGVGPRIARLLLERFQAPEPIFAASEEELVQTGIQQPT